MRNKIVIEAKTWLGTPFHHQARVKGAGVDCANLLIAVYCDLGLAKLPEVDSYSPDWHLHHDEPRFLNMLMQYCEKVEIPLAGDIAMFQYGRQAAHGAIVIDENTVIHAWRDAGKVVQTQIKLSPLENRLVGFYRLQGLK